MYEEKVDQKRYLIRNHPWRHNEMGISIDVRPNGEIAVTNATFVAAEGESRILIRMLDLAVRDKNGLVWEGTVSELAEGLRTIVKYRAVLADTARKLGT